MNEYKPGQRYLVVGPFSENNHIIEITGITGSKVIYKTIKGKPNPYNRFEVGSNFDRCLKLVEENNITINRYGDKVVAKYGEKVGVAKCSPDDTFDFAVGAKLAFSRLMGEPEDKPKPKPEQKFKVGEFVKVIGNSSPMHFFPIGSIVMITDIYATKVPSDSINNIKCYGIANFLGEYMFSNQHLTNKDIEHLPENTHAN